MNVYLDGKFGFGIDLDSLVIFDLRVGKRMSQKRIDEVVRKAEFQKTYDKLLQYSTTRPRSEKEINDWLKRKIGKDLNEELYNKQSLRLRQRLKRLELIDDEKFARWWIEQRNAFRPRSKRVLVQELRLKGIDKYIIENALSEYEINEDVIAKSLYDRNKYKWERLPEFERKQKASAYLARKGFGWDVIKKVIN